MSNRILIFGPTTKTGRLVAHRAKLANYHISLFGPSLVTGTANKVTKIKGDVLDELKVEYAIANHRAVIVCLDPEGKNYGPKFIKAIANIVAGMQQNDVRRLVFLSSVGVGESWKQLSFSAKLAFKTTRSSTYKKLKAAEELITDSQLIWTIARSGPIHEKPSPEEAISTSSTDRVREISSKGLANFLMEQVVSETYLNKAVTVFGL